MELAHMIVDYTRRKELEENKKNICFIGIKFNKNIKYKIYIIPKDINLIIQYNKLALCINRNIEELLKVVKYFNNLISYDYYEYVTNTDNNDNEGDCDFSYEFTLNAGDTVIYKYVENSLINSYSFNIEEIINPLIYLINPVRIPGI